MFKVEGNFVLNLLNLKKFELHKLNSNKAVPLFYFKLFFLDFFKAVFVSGFLVCFNISLSTFNTRLLSDGCKVWNCLQMH